MREEEREAVIGGCIGDDNVGLISQDLLDQTDDQDDYHLLIILSHEEREREREFSVSKRVSRDRTPVCVDILIESAVVCKQ